ncbi:MAG: restriction endonuclease subunit S [Pseudomonadota bacterium]
MAGIEKRPLPHGWRWVNLGECLSALETGSRPRGGAIGVEEGIPSISAEHMTKSGTFDFSAMRYVPKEFFKQMPRGHIKIWDILVVKDGATTGKVSLVTPELPFSKAVINEHVFLCRPNPMIVEPLWLFWWLWGTEGQKSIRSNFQGAAIGGINQSFANTVFVPLPPLSEQKRITAILNKQMAAVERARAATEARLAAAKALPGAYIRKAFENNKAKKWTWRRLGDIAYMLPSKSIALSGDVEVQAITTACLSEGGFLPSGVKTSRMWSKDVPECLVSKGEILVARSNTPDLVGRVSTYNGEPEGVVASDLTIRLWPTKEISSEFLTVYLSYLYLTGYWKERAGGASGSMKKITRGQIQAESVPVPPLSEQEEIAGQVNKRIQEADRVSEPILSEIEVINALPATLLRRAFSGEL